MANTGYSGLVSPYGEVIKKINFNEMGTLSFKLINKKNKNIFKKYGDYIFFIIIIFALIVNLFFKKFFLK